MPKDDERKEMTQEELDAREEKFRTFFTTSVAQVPEEMTRRDDVLDPGIRKTEGAFPGAAKRRWKRNVCPRYQQGTARSDPHRGR